MVIIYSPKFHCELNLTETVLQVHSVQEQTLFKGLEEIVEPARESMSVDSIKSDQLRAY